MVRELRRLVNRGGRRWRRLIILEAVSLAVAVPLAYLWLVFWLDNWLHLPVWGRLLASLVFFAVAGSLAVRLWRSWRRSRFTQDQVALAIERRTPGGLDNRLINALQLSRDTGPTVAPVSSALVAENYQVLKQVRLRQSAEAGPALMRVGAALAVVAIGLGFWGLGQEHFANAATRIFLPFARVAPVYRTILHVEPGDVTVAAGEPVEIAIRIEGQVPGKIAVLVDRGDEQGSHELSVPEGERRVIHTLGAVRGSLAYAVRGGDYVSRWYQVRVPTELRLERLTAVLTPPSYTGKPVRPIESVSGDLEALVGSRAEVKFTFNQPLDRAWMQVDRGSPSDGESGDQSEAGRRVDLERLAPRRFSGEIRFGDISGYRLAARPEGGETRRTRRYRIQAMTDEAPRIPTTWGTVQACTFRNVDRRCSSVPPYDPPPAVASSPTAVFSYSSNPQKSWKFLNVDE
jgi:hypothetical protein